MKNLFKRFTAVIAAVLIFCISIVPSSVFADDSVTYNYNQNVSFTFLNQETSDIATANFLKFNQCSYYKQFKSDFPELEVVPFALSFYYSDIYIFVFRSDVSNFNLSVDYTAFNKFSGNFYVTSYLYKNGHFSQYKTGSGAGYLYINGSKPETFHFYLDTLVPAWDPVLAPLLDYPYNLEIQTQSFVEWLLETGRWTEIPISIADSTLTPYIEYFSKYGGSGSLFVNNLNDFLSHYFESQVTNSVARQVLSKTKSLYQEYLALKNDTVRNHLTNRVNKTDTIDTVTNNDNLTLVTDQEDDSTIISILRDILRFLLSLPSVISDCTNLILNKLDSLNLTTNFVNDFSSDADRIIDSINNITVDVPDTSIDVTITDEKQQELDDFFNGWSVDFDNKVKEKFPVTAQLGELFNDDFFEKCGIDCNGDGEVYSYYSENFYAVSETSTVSELSASSPGSDQKLVTDFLGQFDSSDVNFLNDANFSSSVPDWSITVGGKKCEVFSFKLYAKYRTQIHFIMSFILWTVYLLSLYKSLPQIIGQVSDVIHGIEKM